MIIQGNTFGGIDYIGTLPGVLHALMDVVAPVIILAMMDHPVPHKEGTGKMVNINP